MLVPILVYSCDGGTKVSSSVGFQSALKMLISVESGTGQVLAPRQTSSENIVFTIRDSSAKAIPQIAVEVRLIDTTGVSQVTEEQLRAAWDENRLSISPTAPDPYATNEDIVGRIDFADTMTDSAGQLKVRVIAPESYGRSLAVVAKVLDSNNGADGFGYAIYTTATFGKDETFLLNTSNILAELTGESFSISLSALRQGRVVKALNGKRRFNFQSVASKRLMITKFPEGEVSCNFINGICRIEGGPFVLAGFGQLTVTFKDLDADLAPGEAVISVERGKPSALVLSSTPPPVLTILCHSRISSSEAQPCVRYSADIDAVLLYPAIVDQGDNFMAVPLTNWSASGPLKDRFNLADISANQLLQPYRAGTGTLTVRSDDFLLNAAYEVFPGIPAQHQVFSEHDGIESAVNPFKIRSKVFDRKENFCYNFNGSILAGVKLEGATPSPGGNAPVSYFSELLAFKAGEGLSTLTLLATRAGERPKITLSTNEGIANSQPLTIVPGPTVAAKWRTASAGLGRFFDAPVTLGTDSRSTYYVGGYDKYLNFTADVDSTFRGTGALQNSLTIEDAFVTTIIPKVTGTGTVIATPKLSGVAPVETPLISVSSNTAAAYDIITTNANSEFAGERFQIMIQAKDLNGFLADTYEGLQTLQFVSYRPLSWTGQRAVLPDGTLTCTFIRGICTLDPPLAESGWFVTNGTVPALVSVQDVSGVIRDVWSDFIFPKIGLPDRLLFTDKIGGEAAGALLFEAGILKKITADDSITLAAAVVDRGGNYLQDANASWGGTAAKVAPYFARPSPSVNNTFNANSVISAADMGEIKASLPGVQDALMRVEVSHGIANSIDIAFPGGNQTMAGECIDFVANVVDADKNQVTSYTTDLITLGVGIKNATTAAVALQGGVWPGGPEVLRFVSGFYLPDWQDPNQLNGLKLAAGGPFAGPPYRLDGLAEMTGGYSDVSIIEGRIKFSPKVCLSDTTNIAPQIEMGLPVGTSSAGSHPSVSGISPVLAVVSKGPAFQVQFFGNNNEPLCPISGHQLPPPTKRFADFDSGHPNNVMGINYCIKERSTDLNQLEIIPHFIDAGGNDIGVASGVWETALPDAQLDTGRTAVASTIDLDTPSKLIIGAKRSGNFSVKFTSTTGIVNHITVGVWAGVPKEFIVTPLRNIPAGTGIPYSDGILATSPFLARINLYDQYNNFVTNFDESLPVNFSWAVNPSASPIGTAPRIATDSTLNFRDGAAASSKTFLLPRADVTTTLVTTIPSLTPATVSYSIMSRPGSLTSMHLLDQGTLSGQDIGNITISTDDDLTWHAMGKDSEGNLATNTSTLSTFTVNGILSNDTQSVLNTLVLKPSKPGTASIQVSTIDGNDFTPYPNVTTGTITVVEGRPDRFEMQIVNPPSNNLLAGSSYSLTLKMVDFDGNPIPSFNGSKLLNWDVSNRATNAESRSVDLPTTGYFTFVNGVCTTPLTMTPFAKTASSMITVSATNPVNPGIVVGSMAIAVDAQAFDHYGVATVSSYSPRSNLSTSFSAQIFLRDIAGNDLTSGGPNRSVSLRLVRLDGTPSTGSITGVTSGFNPSITGSASASNLRYDEAGKFYLIAEDGVYTTPFTATDYITMNASPQTVKDYGLTLPAGNPLNLTAGQAYTMTITARDNYNNPVLGIDFSLNALSFTWQGPSPAPDGTLPTLPTPNFVNGVATHSVAFYKAETLLTGLLNLRDNQVSAKLGASTQNIIINAGALNKYDMSSTQTTRTADQQASGLFDISIKAFDSWRNPQVGDSALNLLAVYASGSATSTGDILGSSGTTSETTGLNLSSGTLNLTGLRYLVPHTITFNVAGGTVGAGLRPTISFTPTVHTIASYRVAAPAMAAAGLNNTPVTVSARDVAGNLIASLDSVLNSQAYNWSGANPSFGGQSPVYGTLSSFSGGSATSTHSFYNGGTMVAQSLRVFDNYSAGARSGGNTNDILITPLTVSSLVIDPITAKNAGVAFTLSATVRDTYGNLTSTGCGNLTVSASASGGTDSPGGHDGTVVPASLSAGVAQDSLGHYTTNSNLLYKEAVHTLTASACSTSNVTSVTINEANPAAVFLSTTDTPPGSHLAADRLCPNTSGAAVQCATLYAFFWDAYGNRVDDAANSCSAWSYTNLSTGATVPSVSGSSHSLGLGHSSYLDGTLTCTKGSVSRSVNTYGGVSRVDFVHNYASTVEAALNNVTISSIQLYFRKNNIELAKTDAATETIALSSNSAGNTVSSLGYASNPSCVFSGTGACASSYPLHYKIADTARTLTLTIRGASKDITNINVTPNTATSLTVAAIATQTAGAAFTTAISAKDVYGNPTAKGCANLSVTGGTTSPGGYGGSATAPVLPSSVGQSSVGQYTTGSITLYSKGSNTLSFNACGITQGAGVTVNEAAAQTVYLNNADSIPGSSLTEIHCSNSSGASVSCPTIYAFFWDAYGNPVQTTSTGTCSGWSYSNISGSEIPTVSGATHSFTLAHTNFIDGSLTCSKGLASASLLTYGGVSRLAINNSSVSSPLIAALGNFTVNSMQLYSRKNNVEINKIYSGPTSETITVATDSGLTANGLVSGGSYTCTFSTTGACTTPKAFDLTKAEASKYISYTVRAQAVTVNNITVEPNSANNLFTSISTKQAGTPFTVSLTLRDAFNNTTTRDCVGDLNVTSSGSTSSPGGHGGSVLSASLPSSTAGVSGIFTSGSITLYKAGSNTLIFTACGSVSNNVNVTVSEAPVNAVYLSTTDSAPGSHSTSISCNEGTTVTCPALYAFAWDAYGNELSAGNYACPSWTYIDANTGKSPAASLGSSTGHSTIATNSTWHINGAIRCTASAIQANTTVFGKIQKTQGWSCGNWSCPSTTPSATCTVTNSSGYATSANSFSGQAAGNSLATTTCDNGLATGGNCGVTVSGTTGSASGSLALLATPAAIETANVTMLNPGAVSVNSGSSAPNCTNNLTQAITSDWTCVAGAGRFILSLTNNNGLRSATLPNTDPVFSPVTGASLASIGCKNISLGSGASCTATVSQPNAGVSTDLNFAPNDGFFQNVTVTKSPSPNCTQSGSLNVTPTVAKATSCADSTPYVRLTFTVTNSNTLNSMSFGASPLTMTNGNVVSNTCMSTTVAPGASCNFVMEWSPAPAGGVSTSNITLAENAAYFNDVIINSATANNSCP